MYKCSPPKSCFECPYPDCQQNRLKTSREETEYLRCGIGRKHHGPSEAYHINLPICRKSRLFI